MLSLNNRKKGKESQVIDENITCPNQLKIYNTGPKK